MCRGFFFGVEDNERYVLFGRGIWSVGKSNVDDHSDAKGWRKRVVGHLPGCSHLWPIGCGGCHDGGDRVFASQSDLPGGASRRACHG